ncbi:MAG TPA: hypothetical protein VNG12_15530, partial [Acidimicrobiales bacterium]|nr:hypothetical protein [Acidimicrobiales bacterium]
MVDDQFTEDSGVADFNEQVWRVLRERGHNRHIVLRAIGHFGYAIDKRYLPLLLPFLLRPARDGVTLTNEGVLVATFGLFK